MSKIEVDAIEPQSGTTLTIGASGDSVNIASGATITDFTSTGIDDNATSTAITIDSSENVGIGTASPSSKLQVVGGQLRVTESDASSMFLVNPSTTYANGVDIQASYSGVGSFGPLKFTTGGAERMRIDSSGNLILGATASGAKFHLQYDGNATVGQLCKDTYASAGTNKAIQFVRNAVEVGTITMTTTATAFNTSSDYRLKENVNYNFDATTRLKQLKPARFNFIRDADKTVDGFLAHEVQDIIPEAIHGIKDQTETKEKVVVNSNGRVIAENIEQADWEAGKILNEEGTSNYPVDSTWEASKIVPVYQGIDQSKLTPILTKALQEAIARIEQLEARITTLENK
jgi:hypothetical protein